MTEFTDYVRAFLAFDFRNGKDWAEVADPEGEYPVYGSGGAFGHANHYLYDGEAVLFGRKGTLDRPLYVNEKFWTVDTMYYAIPKSGYDGKFLYYWAQTIPFDLISTQTAIPSMTSSDLGRQRVPYLALETQRRIADYLDKEISEIDALIEEFEGLVNSLGIRKRLLVDSIFDQNVPRLALKFLADFVPGFAFPSTSFTDDPNCTFLFRGVNLKPGIIDPTDSLYFDGSIEVPERFVLREGDVVLGMDRPFIKSGVRVATIPQEFEGSYLVQRVLKIEGRTDAYTRLFTYALSSSRFIDHITPDFTGISVPHLSADQVGSFSVPLLSESEAQRVVDRLDSEFENTNFLIEESTKLIENLKARKTALITEVVTGRKEV